MGLTIAAALGAGRIEASREEARFARRVDLVHDTVRDRMDVHASLLRGLVGLFAASREVEPDEFVAYVRGLRVREHYPSLLGLGYAAQVEPGGGAVVVFLEPRDRGNAESLGVDLSEDPALQAAVDEARDAGSLVASEVVTLAQGEPGLNIFAAIYDNALPTTTPEERRAAVNGYAYAKLSVTELLGDRLLGGTDLSVQVWEQADGHSARAIVESVAPEGGAAQSRTLTLPGRTWTMEYQDLTTLPSFWTSGAGLTLSLGLVASGLLFRSQAHQVRARLAAEQNAQAIERASRRLRFLADAMPQIVFSADPSGRLLTVNRGWGEAAANLSEQWEARLHPDDLARVQASWRAAIASGTPWQEDLRMRTSADAPYRWLLGRALPSVGDRSAQEWVGTLTDIHDQQCTKARLEKIQVELEERVRARTEALQGANQELEDVVLVASHDLQEPLRKIVTFGDRLAMLLEAQTGEAQPGQASTDGSWVPEGRDALRRIRRAALRMRQLLHDLLALSQIARTPLNRVPVDLGALTQEVLADLDEPIRASGARVEVGPLPIVRGDAGLLYRVLENLLTNALKFHIEGRAPEVQISAERAGGEADPARPEAFVRLVVTDAGIGFDEKYLDRIFVMFQRLHPTDHYDGTGVGLAICKKIIDLHGGTIGAESRPGRGARFRVTLELAPAPAPIPSPPPSLPPRAAKLEPA